MDARYAWETQKMVPHMEHVRLAYCSGISSADGCTPGDARDEGRLCLLLASVDGCRSPLSTTQFSSLFLLFPGFGAVHVNSPLSLATSCWHCSRKFGSL